MYATIEPRLIALLNDTSSDSSGYPRLDLPPLQDPNILKASGRPFLLEPDAGTRSKNHTSVSSQQTALFERDPPNGTITRIGHGAHPPQSPPTSKRSFGGTSPQSLHKILDDTSVDSQGVTTNKRHRTDSNKDDFVQLPQLPKKLKAAKQVVPPIIIGLFEPPPNAALFPPIASSSFHDSHGRNSLNIAPPVDPKDGIVATSPPKVNELMGEMRKDTKKSALRPRKKWSEEETNQMLLGVQKHGIGNWTKILLDPEFKFNGRKAVDVKDRFRTCCPVEMRGKVGKDLKSPRRGLEDSNQTTKSSSRLMSHNMMVDPGYVTSDGSSDDNGGPMNKFVHKPRAHRKKLEDLAELGIKQPFKKSQRRERRPFSEEEDLNILKGFQVYGPSWTLIQKDQKFGLESRRPTDLRDRLRNKYPERYFNDEEARKVAKERVNDNQTVTMTTSNPSLHASDPPSSQDQSQIPNNSGYLEPKSHQKGSSQLQNPTYNFRDPFSELLEPPPTSDPPDGFSFNQSFDWSDNLAPFSGGIGEMDISRLLLDDSWNPNISNLQVKRKQSFSDVNSICTSLAPSMPQFISSYGMPAYDSSQVLSLPIPLKKDP